MLFLIGLPAGLDGGLAGHGVQQLVPDGIRVGIAAGEQVVRHLHEGVRHLALAQLVGPGWERECFPSKLHVSLEIPQGSKQIIFQRTHYKASRAFKFQVF